MTLVNHILVMINSLCYEFKKELLSHRKGRYCMVSDGFSE